MGEYEPNDSRNVTGTATTQDGRWTAQGQQPPDAEGQMPGRQTQGQRGQGGDQAIQFEPDPQLAGEVRSIGQMAQGGQSVGQAGEGVNSAANQSNDHTSGIGQEQQFDAAGQSEMDQNATAQAGQTGWTTANAAGQVRPGQSVVDSQGQHVGTVDSVDGDRIKLTCKDSPDGKHHYVSASQVESCEGDEVRLSCSTDPLQS